jgi:hypothetical protein
LSGPRKTPASRCFTPTTPRRDWKIYNSNQAANGRDHFGNGNKFIAPTIAHGKVYVGTTNGVGVFGLLK